MSYLIKKRFQGYLPVVVDVETGGVNPKIDALLEVAAVFVEMNPDTGMLTPKLDDPFHSHVTPFEGAKIENEALEINKIVPNHPFRFAEKEQVVAEALFEAINEQLRQTGCRRAVLVGHNATFDLSFVQALAKRTKLFGKIPFHKFTVFDTATLGGVAYGKTVLAKALHQAKIPFRKDEAHSALYDTQKTAELFCKIVNQFDPINN